MGYNWYDIITSKYNITYKSESLPLTFLETPNTIIQEVIECNTCGKGYNVSPIEMELLKSFDQPIPRSCPTCRHTRRFNRTNKPILYDRTCDKCNIKIKTPYSPDRPEIVYCVKCYQAEFL